MKKIILISIVVLSIFWQSCTKETVTNNTTKIPYVAPVSKIYGKWKLINSNPTDLKEQYWIIDSLTPFAYLLTKSDKGFKSMDVGPYAVTENTLLFDGIFAYEVSNDSLFLKSNPNKTEAILVKTTQTEVNYQTWMTKTSTLLTTPALPGMYYINDGSFAFDANVLYFTSNYTGSNYLYKYDAASSSIKDSLSISGNIAGFYKKSTNHIYVASNYSTANPIVKVPNFTTVGAAVATSNSLNYVKSLSYNPNSGVMYAFQNTNKLFSATESGSLNVLFDVASTGVAFDQMSYYSNDEFLVLYQNTIYKVKIAPSFSILNSYQQLPNFTIYSISTNGTETWVYGENNVNRKYEFRKISF